MRIRSREELFQKADQFIIRRYDDGRIDAVDAYQKRRIIHTTQVVYETRSGRPYIANVIGFLFPEVWDSREQILIETVPERSQLAGANINKLGSAYIAGNGGDEITSYAVPTDKTLYVTQISVVRLQTTGNIVGVLKDSVLGGVLYLGGAQGSSIDLSTPQKFVGGRTVSLYIYNVETTADTIYGSFAGYLV